MNLDSLNDYGPAGTLLAGVAVLAKAVGFADVLVANVGTWFSSLGILALIGREVPWVPESLTSQLLVLGAFVALAIKTGKLGRKTYTDWKNEN